MTLEDRALVWIEPYWNAEHLVRTRDWLLELEPEASEALRLAALTHDMERHCPGGPVEDLRNAPEANTEYRRAHSERSAQIVGDWLAGEGAAEELMDEVRRLILAHETGGAPDEDLVQAADSLSFLEVNAPVMVRWFTSGRCDRERSKAQLRWMLERIRVPGARELAEPLYEEAVAVVDRA
ncbi:MAG TPA: DUF4202 family protein [Gaiellaceae bacterium]|nr:DUF4202 family protein [Gaiellaceae bacterium]